MIEEYKEVEEVSYIRQSLDNVKEKIEKLHEKENLEVLSEITEKEVEDVNSEPWMLERSMMHAIT